MRSNIHNIGASSNQCGEGRTLCRLPGLLRKDQRGHHSVVLWKQHRADHSLRLHVRWQKFGCRIVHHLSITSSLYPALLAARRYPRTLQLISLAYTIYSSRSRKTFSSPSAMPRLAASRASDRTSTEGCGTRAMKRSAV